MSTFKSILNDICTCFKKDKDDENIFKQKTKKFENLVIKVQERKSETDKYEKDKESVLDRGDDYFITRLSDIHFQVKNMCKRSNILDYELVSFNEKVPQFY
jgi:hypothetical protein